MTIPVNKTLQQNFKWRVEKTPNNIAHKFLDRETSFKDLDLISNKVANGLIKEGCKTVSYTHLTLPTILRV